MLFPSSHVKNKLRILFFSLLVSCLYVTHLLTTADLHGLSPLTRILKLPVSLYVNRHSLIINEAILNDHKLKIKNLMEHYKDKYVYSDAYWRSIWPAVGINVSTQHQFICELKSLPSTSFTMKDAQRYGFHRPELYPYHSFLHGKKFKSCAIVGSSGELLMSEAGVEIDSHDAVVRFNEAITEGYERHVGNKTTLRIINPSVVTQTKEFNKQPFFNKREIRLWFDIPYYNTSPNQWHKKNLMPKFIPTYIERMKNNDTGEDFILHTDVLWGQYKALQRYADVKLPYKTASSGFMGIVLMMNYCVELVLYGFMRTVNSLDKCYYWKDTKKTDCDFLPSHPLPTEKRIYLELNTLNDYETFVEGKIKLLGFDKWNCDQS